MAISGVTDYTNAYAADRAKGSSPLNGDSQAYLNSLKEKYPDVNITVSSSIVEKMASDPAAAAKYEKVFAEMSGNSERIEKFARENNDEILSAGALIDKNGKVSYWMVGRSKDTMENPGTVYKEKVQKQIAEKRAKKKEEEALKEKKLAKAESVEKLTEQIKAGTSQPAKMQEEGKGAQLDLTI